MAEEAHAPARANTLIWAISLVVFGVVQTVADQALAAVPVGCAAASDRVASQPSCWLVLCNANSADSVSWAAWYAEQWGVPSGHLLSLNASLDEGLPDRDAVQDQIITPVRSFLEDNPEIEQEIMGILLGYGLPGHYGNPPGVPHTGGFSVADALQDMHDDGLEPAAQKGNNADNPHNFGSVLPPDGRLTKETMAEGMYMVARIDGPTLADAMALTDRAKALSGSFASLYGDHMWFDYYDTGFPSSDDEWHWLREAVESPELADMPWAEYDLAGQVGTPHPWSEAFRFGIYKLYGWSVSDFESPNAGRRVLAFNFNSFGAVTVRSTTDEGELFVPNALAAGYAAAVGATGEPQCCIAPFPDTFLASLREGWTLGEAFYLANPYNDWMWTLLGDPLLTLPNWFDDMSGDGDMNDDDVVNGLDIQGFVGVLLGSIDDPEQVAIANLNSDGEIDDDDCFLLLGPLLYDTYDPNVLRGSGDANGDGLVNGDDIAVFADRLINGFRGFESLRELYGPDMNQDGEVTMDDTPLFIDSLL